MKQATGLKITNPSARDVYELNVQLTSGNFTVVEVTAHSKAEAERMAKQHGYQLHRGGHLDMPAPSGITSGKEALAWGAFALAGSTFPVWFPALLRLVGWTG